MSRFFLYKNPPFKKKGIWFHACSLGEVKSLKPLIDKITLPVNVSTVTYYGYEEGKKSFLNLRFLPFESFMPFWQRDNYSLVVLEAEFWLFMFYIAKKRGARTFLLNARMSDGSYKRYLRFRWFYRHLFKYVDTIYCQSEIDMIRLKKLGATNIYVFGNIKAFNNIRVTRCYKKQKQFTIVMASTHKGEEEAILDNITIKSDMKIIVAPRHSSRFNSVDNKLKMISNKKKLSYSRFSISNNFDCDITLFDKIGLLVEVYAISDMTILGGSFVDGWGGHNPIEPAFFKNILISGTYIYNQKHLFEMINKVYLSDVKRLQNLIDKKDNLEKSSVGFKNHTLKNILEDITYTSA